MKKLLCFFLIIIMVILSSCGELGSIGGSHISDYQNEHEETVALTEATIDSIDASAKKAEQFTGKIYAKELIELPDGGANIFDATLTGEAIFLYGKDNYDKLRFFLICPSDLSTTLLPIEFAEEYWTICASAEDAFPILLLDENGRYLLDIFNKTGLVEQISLELPEYLNNDVIIDLLVLPEFLIVTTSNKVISYTRQGTFVSEICDYYIVADCMLDSQNKLVVARQEKSDAISEQTEVVVSVFDLHLQLQSVYRSQDLCDAFCKSDTYNTVLALKNGIAYIYDYTTDSKTAIIDTVSSGINTNDIFIGPNGSFISVQYRMPALWHEVDSQRVTTITLASYNLENSLKQIIDAYNESSTDCKIKVVDYSNIGGGDGLTRFKTEIAAGFTPDLYDLTNLQANDFIKKGLLEDLHPLLKSKGIDLADFLPNAIDMLETDDKKLSSFG